MRKDAALKGCAPLLGSEQYPVDGFPLRLAASS